jgi:hypothetical protein
VRGRLVDLRMVRQQFAARSAARTLEREHPGLVSDLGGRIRTDARHVLLVSLSNDPQQLRLEGILAKALQLRGGRVTLLAYRRGAPWSTQLLKAFR